jgi:hypothetical protein
VQGGLRCSRPQSLCPMTPDDAAVRRSGCGSHNPQAAAQWWLTALLRLPLYTQPSPILLVAITRAVRRPLRLMQCLTRANSPENCCHFLLLAWVVGAVHGAMVLISRRRRCHMPCLRATGAQYAATPTRARALRWHTGLAPRIALLCARRGPHMLLLRATSAPVVDAAVARQQRTCRGLQQLCSPKRLTRVVIRASQRPPYVMSDQRGEQPRRQVRCCWIVPLAMLPGLAANDSQQRRCMQAAMSR